MAVNDWMISEDLIGIGMQIRDNGTFSFIILALYGRNDCNGVVETVNLWAEILTGVHPGYAAGELPTRPQFSGTM